MTDIVHCKRLDKQITGRIQPLLVILETAAQAAHIITAARNLCNSSDTQIRQEVYIYANLTKADANAAYQVHCARRQAAKRSKQHQQQQQHTTSQSTVSGRHFGA